MSGSNPITTTLLGLWIASFNGMCLQLLTHVNMNEIPIPRFSSDAVDLSLALSKKQSNSNNKYSNNQEEKKEEKKERELASVKLKIKMNTELNKVFFSPPSHTHTHLTVRRWAPL